MEEPNVKGTWPMYSKRVVIRKSIRLGIIRQKETSWMKLLRTRCRLNKIIFQKVSFPETKTVLWLANLVWKMSCIRYLHNSPLVDKLYSHPGNQAPSNLMARSKFIMELGCLIPQAKDGFNNIPNSRTLSKRKLFISFHLVPNKRTGTPNLSTSIKVRKNSTKCSSRKVIVQIWRNL